MKVVIFNKSKDEEIENVIEEIKERMSDYECSKDISVYIEKDFANLVQNFDVYILVVSDMEELDLCINKIKKANKVLILTKNTDANFILSCVNYTKNLVYLNAKIDFILKKIISIYTENNRIYLNKNDKYAK